MGVFRSCKRLGGEGGGPKNRPSAVKCSGATQNSRSDCNTRWTSIKNRQERTESMTGCIGRQAGVGGGFRLLGRIINPPPHCGKIVLPLIFTRNDQVLARGQSQRFNPPSEFLNANGSDPTKSATTDFQPDPVRKHQLGRRLQKPNPRLLTRLSAPRRFSAGTDRLRPPTGNRVKVHRSKSGRRFKASVCTFLTGSELRATSCLTA